MTVIWSEIWKFFENSREQKSYYEPYEHDLRLSKHTVAKYQNIEDKTGTLRYNRRKSNVALLSVKTDVLWLPTYAISSVIVTNTHKPDSPPCLSLQKAMNKQTVFCSNVLFPEYENVRLMFALNINYFKHIHTKLSKRNLIWKYKNNQMESWCKLTVTAIYGLESTWNHNLYMARLCSYRSPVNSERVQ
jgi:hypothetical protein